MVTITYPSADTNVYYHCTVSASGFTTTGPNLYYYDSSTVETITFNVDGLAQGESFDRFHNKAVHHKKVDIHINLVTQPLDSKVVSVTYSDGESALKTTLNGKTIAWRWQPGGRCLHHSGESIVYKGRNDDTPNTCIYTILSTKLSSTSSKKVTFRYRKSLTVDGKTSVSEKSVTTSSHFISRGISRQAAIKYARSVLLNIRHSVAPFETSDYDKIMSRLWDGTNVLDVNNIENVLSLKEFKKQIPPILNVLKKRDIKSVSDLYLWYKYTYKTTESDARRCIKYFHKQLNLAKHRYNKVSAANTTFVVSDNLYSSTTIRCHAYFSVKRSLLKQLGLDPSASNLWDIIPFSFVVDWFVNVGDVLESLDRGADLLNTHMASLYQSRKEISRGCAYLDDHGGVYSYSYSYYTRGHMDYLPVSVHSFALKNPFIHFVDGAALAISCRR